MTGISVIADFTAARGAMLRRLSAARAARFGGKIYAPGHDDVDMRQWEGGFDVPPVAFHIVYSDSISRLSGRCVTVRRIREEVSEVRLSCFCHTRRAPRTFLATRIVELIELSCGEVFDDALTYFRHHPLFKPLTGEHIAALSPATLAVQECRDEIILLSFLAAGDGMFGEGDEDHIVTHVLDRVPDSDVSEAEVRAKVREFVPDEGAFERSLTRMCAGGGDSRMLMRTMRRIIDASGTIELQEMAFADAIQSKLKESGRL